MASRLTIFKRLPITAAFAGKRTPVVARFNSTSTTSAASRTTAKVMEMAAAAEKPSAFEASVPFLWLLSGAACLTAWNRIDGEKEDHVEKLLIV